MRRATTPGGVEIAYHVESADPGAPTFVLAHATGFCGAVWEPVLSLIRERSLGGGLVVVDQRAHGASGSSPHPFDWWDVGRDLLAVIADIEPERPLVGVGHSGGGAGLLLAEILAPATFAGIVAVEPIVPPPPFERTAESPIAMNAARRRRWFPSREAARERWAGRFPFDEWDPTALDAYLRHGLVPGEDPETGRDGYVLACSPEDEAEWFAGAPQHGAWERLSEVACPVVVVAGSHSDTHADGPPEEIAARLADAELRMIADGDHFIPMALPAVVADIALELSVGLSR